MDILEPKEKSLRAQQASHQAVLLLCLVFWGIAGLLVSYFRPAPQQPAPQQVLRKIEPEGPFLKSEGKPEPQAGIVVEVGSSDRSYLVVAREALESSDNASADDVRSSLLVTAVTGILAAEKIESNDSEILALKDDVLERCVSFAKTSFEKAQFEAAHEITRWGLELAPRHQELLQLRAASLRRLSGERKVRTLP